MLRRGCICWWNGGGFDVPATPPDLTLMGLFLLQDLLCMTVDHILLISIDSYSCLLWPIQMLARNSDLAVLTSRQDHQCQIQRSKSSQQKPRLPSSLKQSAYHAFLMSSLFRDVLSVVVFYARQWTYNDVKHSFDSLPV